MHFACHRATPTETAAYIGDVDADAHVYLWHFEKIEPVPEPLLMKSGTAQGWIRVRPTDLHARGTTL